MSYVQLMGFGRTGWGSAMVAAAVMTLLVSLAALLIGIGIGAVVAGAKLSNNIVLRGIGDVYTTVLRGVPDLLVIYLVYFGGSAIVTYVAKSLGQQGFLGVPSFLAGSLAVGLASGAYQTEVFRGAYLAIPRGQLEAAKAVGMSAFLRFRRIVVPQVLAIALPGIGNVWQLALKDSALISVTGLAELMNMSKSGSGSTHQPFAFYVTAGALYLVLTTGSTFLFDKAEFRMTRSMRRI